MGLGDAQSPVGKGNWKFHLGSQFEDGVEEGRQVKEDAVKPT